MIDFGIGFVLSFRARDGLGKVQSAKQDTGMIMRRISPVAIVAAYAVMAFPDGIGVMAARFGMEGSASTLMFLWFALLPIPAGKLCGRMGGRWAVALSLAVALPAFVLLWQGESQSVVVASGFALAGISNVMLQTTAPVWAAESFGAARLSGVLTAGLFVKTSVAIGLPFAVMALFAFGYANIYGFVYGVAAPRHPGAIPSVSALLTLSIAGGALSSPLMGAFSGCGTRSAVVLVFVLTVVLAGLFASIRRRI